MSIFVVDLLQHFVCFSTGFLQMNTKFQSRYPQINSIFVCDYRPSVQPPKYVLLKEHLRRRLVAAFGTLRLPCCISAGGHKILKHNKKNNIILKHKYTLLICRRSTAKRICLRGCNFSCRFHKDRSQQKMFHRSMSTMSYKKKNNSLISDTNTMDNAIYYVRSVVHWITKF